jgi:ribosome biogenesis GTPase
MEIVGATYEVGSIVRVEERLTLLSRKAAGKVKREQVLAANVDQLAIVIAAASPDYHRRLIDRYLIAADKGDLNPLIIVNKLDLVGGELLEVILEDLEVYSETLGLYLYFVSSATGQGMGPLAEHLQGKSTLFAGQSGVGKSSLINRLTENELKVGEISKAYNRGRHTTTSAVVLPLPGGGAVVDSPGIREFAIWELDADELPHYFQEFTPYLGSCRFAPCTHTHEPGCAVKAAVDEGAIEEGRYISYTILLEEVG